MENLIQLRNYYISTFNKRILIFEKNKILVDNYYLLFFMNLVYPLGFKYILKNLNINYVYELDNLIFFEDNNKQLNIGSIIIDVTVNNEYDNFNILDILKKYSLNMPIYIFAKLENINLKDSIRINILKFGKIITKEYILEDIKFKKIIELL